MKETRMWTWHMIAGIAILFLGGLHMVITHLDGLLRFFNPNSGVAIDWGNVVYRARMVFFAVVYILLLTVTLFHGLFGLRNILLETQWGQRSRKGIHMALWFVGALLFIIGTYAAIAALSL